MTRRPGLCSAGLRRSGSPPHLPRRHTPSSDCKSPRTPPISQTQCPTPKGRGMPSFDIVPRLDLAEVDNAIAGIDREIATRFDFKGSKCSVKREEGAINLVAD